MYTEFYKLDGEPFLHGPDHRFYFQSIDHAQAMSYLTYGINCREGFIVITGETGVGKTTLIKRLFASLDERCIHTAHIVIEAGEGVDIIRMIATAFGMKVLAPDRRSLLTQLLAFFEGCLLHNSRTLLIVEEAQNLPPHELEELRLLTSYRFQDAAPFQCFLIGQPQFRALLATPYLEPLRQRIIASYHMAPLNREECGGYIVQRLQTVGWQSDPSFGTDAFESIYDHTGGIPCRINKLCKRLLLYGQRHDRHHFSQYDVNAVANSRPPELSKEATGLAIGTRDIDIDGKLSRVVRDEIRKLVQETVSNKRTIKSMQVESNALKTEIDVLRSTALSFEALLAEQKRISQQLEQEKLALRADARTHRSTTNSLEASTADQMTKYRQLDEECTALRSEAGKIKNTTQTLVTLFTKQKTKYAQLEEEAEALRQQAKVQQLTIDRLRKTVAPDKRFSSLWNAFFSGAAQVEISNTERHVRIEIFADIWFKLRKGEVNWTKPSLAKQLHPDNFRQPFEKAIREEILKNVNQVFQI